MDFTKIPEYITSGEVSISEWSGEAYCDTELDDIYLEPPEKEGINFTSETLQEHFLSTMCEYNVKFIRYRWTRGREVIEYWTGEYELGRDMLFAYASGDSAQYLIISCLNGHPGILTPTISWENIDGSTDAPEIKFATAEQLIEKIYPIGVDFVRNQIH